MRITVLVIACAALLAMSAMVCAGPFGSVSTIKVSGDEFGSDTLLQQMTGGHVSIGYARFSFKSIRPEVAALGTTIVPGGTQTNDAGGIILSAEACRMMDQKSGAMLRIGGWFALPGEAGGGQSGENVGDIHVGYRFNKYVGLEVGQFIGDGQDAFGKNSAYLTYELPPTSESDVAFMFGVGTITKGDSFVATGLPAMRRETDVSAFVNGMYGMQNDTTLNVGVWYMRQRLSMPAFTFTSPSGPVAVGATSGRENVVNWTISVGKKF